MFNLPSQIFELFQTLLAILHSDENLRNVYVDYQLWLILKNTVDKDILPFLHDDELLCNV